MRRLSAVLVALSLSIAASLLAHQAGYVAMAPDPAVREHLLAETGHGYLQHLALVLSVLAVLLIASMLGAALGAREGRGGAKLGAWPFMVVGPLCFAAQEHVERALHGAAEWGLILDRGFRLGLAIQLLAAVLAWAVATLLLAAARHIGARFVQVVIKLRAGGAIGGCLPAVAFHRTATPGGPALLSSAAGRAPPVVAAA